MYYLPDGREILRTVWVIHFRSTLSIKLKCPQGINLLWLPLCCPCWFYCRKCFQCHLDAMTFSYFQVRWCVYVANCFFGVPGYALFLLPIFNRLAVVFLLLLHSRSPPPCHISWTSIVNRGTLWVLCLHYKWGDHAFPVLLSWGPYTIFPLLGSYKMKGLECHFFYNNISSQLDAKIKKIIDNYNQLNMFRAIISPILRSTRLSLQLVI